MVDLTALRQMHTVSAASQPVVEGWRFSRMTAVILLISAKTLWLLMSMGSLRGVWFSSKIVISGLVLSQMIVPFEP